MVPQVVEEDVVVLMIVFQDLEQGFLGLRAGPRECVGAQNRGWEPRRWRKKTFLDAQGRRVGGGGLVSSEQVADGGSHGPSFSRS